MCSTDLTVAEADGEHLLGRRAGQCVTQQSLDVLHRLRVTLEHVIQEFQPAGAFRVRAILGVALPGDQHRGVRRKQGAGFQRSGSR